MQNERRWHLLGIGAVAVVTALSLAACSSGSSGPSAAVDSVTIVIPEEPTSLDGCDTQLSDTGWVIANNVVQALTQIDPNTGKTVAQLADSWTQDSDTQWTFKLHPGVKFSDGTAFDATAAKFNIDRIANVTGDAIKGCSNVANWAGESVTATVIDPLTLQIVTSIVDPLLPTRLVWANMMSPATTPADAKVDTPIGTGPYTVSSWTKTESIVLSRNDSYYGTEPAMKTATFVWRKDSSVRADMVHTGEADIATGLAPEDVAGDANAQTYTLDQVAALRLDTDVAPLNDVRVRQAIAESIDRQTIVSTLMQGIGEVSQQFVTDKVSGFIPNYTGVPYNLDDAKSLVAAAKADGVPVDTPIQLYDRGDLYPGESEVIQAIVTDINQAGLNVQLNNVDQGTWVTYNRKPWPADHGPRIVSTSSNNNTPDESFNIISYVQPDGSHASVNDPQLTDLVNQAFSAPVGPQRDQLWQQVSDRVYRQLYYIVPFAYVNALLTVGDKVNFQADDLTSVSVNIANITSK